MFACVFVLYLLRNGWTDLANLLLLAPSWSRDGFQPNKFRILDRDFLEIRKNPVFRVLFERFGLNSHVKLTLTKIYFNTIKFWIGYPVFQIRNPVFHRKSGMIKK